MSTTTSACSADELRSLFLFEKLTDDQLSWLCEHGRVEVVAEVLSAHSCSRYR